MYRLAIALCVFTVGSGLLGLHNAIVISLCLPLPTWLGHNPCAMYCRLEFYLFEILFGVSAGVAFLPAFLLCLVITHMYSRKRRGRVEQVHYRNYVASVAAASLTFVCAAGIFWAIDTALSYPADRWLAPLVRSRFGETSSMTWSRWVVASLYAVTKWPAVISGLLVAWFVDTSRVRCLDAGGCAKCGYLLTGLTGRRCPECGTPIPPEQMTANAAGAEHGARPHPTSDEPL